MKDGIGLSVQLSCRTIISNASPNAAIVIHVSIPASQRPSRFGRFILVSLRKHLIHPTRFNSHIVGLSQLARLTTGHCHLPYGVISHTTPPLYSPWPLGPHADAVP